MKPIFANLLISFVFWATIMVKCLSASCGTYDSCYKTCCDGVLHSGADKTCCGNKTYDPYYSTCCNGVLHPGKKSCCGAQAYDSFYKTCCEGVLHSGSGKSCCGSKAYDDFYESCCDGEIHSGSGLSCCGSQTYDSFYKTCCNGVLHSGSGMSCCGTQAYDEFYDSCCAGVCINSVSYITLIAKLFNQIACRYFERKFSCISVKAEKDQFYVFNRKFFGSLPIIAPTKIWPPCYMTSVLGAIMRKTKFFV